jgi:lipopolysaccharide/colanic/teichoic acid biosynthesis glycosyltransferase
MPTAPLPETQPIPTPSEPRSTRRFRFLLLAYIVLTIVTFRLVQRYAIEIVRLYNYDIRSELVQWSAYFAIYVVVTLIAYAVLRSLPLRFPRESRLRFAFIAGATLSAIVALYQWQYGTAKLVNYFACGTLGTFAAVLFVTRREFGLVEVVANPPPETIAAVEQGHAGIALADAPWDRGKRVLESILSLIIICISLPISILLALAVWLQDPGPLLVAKVAVMRGGRSFNQLKLRSMVKDAEGPTGPVPAAPTDARVTRLGHVLRRTHIDELPQLLNIARGHMSLVGPRPERTVFVLRHLHTIPHYAERHAVRPGLAGMAQVYGDYYSTPREKLRYDHLYIKNRSLGLDFKLFSSAVLLALFGLSPRRRPHRHARKSVDRQRFQRAYEALRGEAAPDGVAAENGGSAEINADSSAENGVAAEINADSSAEEKPLA